MMTEREVDLEVGYDFDIFISYRRHKETRSWIQEHFYPLLEMRVSQALGHDPVIFVDDQLEAGRPWPGALGNALGRSRIVVVLWSGNYLQSPWCAAELAAIVDREKKAAAAGWQRTYALLIPFIIHDGDHIPGDLSDIQRVEIHESFNVRMAKDGKRAEELDAALKSHAGAIAAAIRNAPAFDEAWATGAARNLVDTFIQQRREQTWVPRFAPGS